MRPAVEGENEAGPGGDLRNIAGQQGVAGHVCQEDVEFTGQPDGQWLVGAARGFLFFDVAAQTRRLVRAQLARQARDHQALQSQAHGEDIARLLPARLCHGGAVIAAQFHQPFAGKAAQRIAHQGAAHAEALADGVLGQFGPGFKGLLDDRPAQGLINGAGTIGAGPGRRSCHVGSRMAWRVPGRICIVPSAPGSVRQAPYPLAMAGASASEQSVKDGLASPRPELRTPSLIL